MRKPFLLLSVLAVMLAGGGAAAQDGPARITVPRWLDPPKVDGRCDDPAYQRGGSIALKPAGASAALVHSSLDLYLCFGKLPLRDSRGGDVQRIVLRVDPTLGRGERMGPGQYAFSVTPAGVVRAEQGSANGKLVPLKVPEGEVVAKVSAASGTWAAEVRISLEWLGGYARTDGLGVTLEGKDGAALQRWPETGTWGELALAPLYPKEAAAGSVFLDGREGYLSVPYAPELNPREITVEAWVRVVDGDCGTLVGNGQASSYWLGLCDGVRFGHGGAATLRGAPYPLGDGWHHVAATMDAAGVRTLYVDGAVVLQPGWEPPHEGSGKAERTPVKLGASALPLRIGSDRDAPDRDPLHGYVRELRIWSRARTADEIRATALVALKGTEPGLVALWPFTSDLRDVAGGHHAGLVGNAALAREAPRVSKLPDPPARRPYTYPKPKPIPAWDARVPAAADEKAMKLDGECSQTEYARAAKLTLEPDRLLHMRMMVAGDALYLCTNVLVGRSGSPRSSVTLWLDRDGKPGKKPTASELRLRLTPDGKLQAGTGKGQGYGGPAPAGIGVKILSGDRLQVQEDLRPLNAPWWSGELRIPLAALAPFRPGSPLRLAVAYDGEAPAASRLPGEVRERWPATFQELRSDTWGAVRSERPAPPPGAIGIASVALISSDLRTFISSQSALAGTNPPPSAPTQAVFDDRCTWFSPAYLYSTDAKWPLVDESRPNVQAAGTLIGVHIAGQDSGFIHTSHDVDMKMTLRLEDRFTSLATVAGFAVSGGPNQILETESAGFPPNRDRDQGARPSVGDHVTVLGRWIFDCGHEPKTEIHPTPMFESDRLEARPIWPGGPLRTVRVVRVWMNSDPEPVGYEFNGPFTFEAELPPAGWSPFLRVVEGDPSRVSATRTGDRLQISVDPPDRTGTFYFELLVGHLVQPEDVLSRTSRVATIGSWEVDVLDDHDSLSSGEWFYSVNVNGHWRQLMWDDDIDTGLSRAVLDSFPVSGPSLHLQVAGYEEDPTLENGGGEPIFPDPDQDPATDGEGGFDRGPLDHPQPSPLLAPDWRLHYNVTPGGDMPPILGDEPFWSPRLAGEPNDSTPVSLGTLPVPARGQPALSTRRDSFLTEPVATGSPAAFGETTLFDAEVDRYRFALADFADVEFGTLTPPLRLDVEAWSPWHASGSLPATLKVEIAPGRTQDRNTADVIGSGGARLRVSSPDGHAGDKPYALEVRTRFRELPPDWGESRDSQGGRTIDLVTVPPNPAADPRLRIDAPTQWFPEKRTLAADWAWQHVVTDTDLYRVLVPPVPGPPVGHAACQFDLPGRLIVRGSPMTLAIPSLPTTGGLGIVIVGDLRSALPNGGAVLVQVSATAPPRRLYQLEAEWESTRYYTPSECDQMRQSLTSLRSLTPRGELELLKGMIALQRGDRVPVPGPRPEPDPVSTDLPPLGDFRVVRPEKGGALDLVVSSPEGQPVLVRLFDDKGILIGESAGLDETAAGKTPAPAGLVPQARLKMEGLEAGRVYLLQVVPRESTRETSRVPLGFGEMPR